MLLELFINFIISVLVIIVLHYLYNYLKKSMTTPEVKDLINKPTRKYNKVYEILNEKPSIQEKEQMKMELKSFMKTETSDNQNDKANNTSVPLVNETGFDSFSGNAEYSTI